MPNHVADVPLIGCTANLPLRATLNTESLHVNVTAKSGSLENGLNEMIEARRKWQNCKERHVSRAEACIQNQLYSYTAIAVVVLLSLRLCSLYKTAQIYNPYIHSVEAQSVQTAGGVMSPLHSFASVLVCSLSIRRDLAPIAPPG